MTVGDNTIHPLLIEDARDAAYKASELQRGVEDRLRNTSRALAAAEQAYRLELSKRIVALRADGNAITACETIAKETKVAHLRYERDVAEGVHEATKQEAYRRGADRKDIAALVAWSRARDLRTDAPPVEWGQAIGAAA